MRLKRLLQLTFPNKHAPINIESISLDLKIALGAYIRSCADEGMSTLLPIGENRQPIRLSPDVDFSCSLVCRLYKANIVQFDTQNTPPASISINAENAVVVSIKSAFFIPNVAGVNGDLLSIKELSMNIESWLEPLSDDDVESIEELWKELALHESLEYLNFVLGERDLPFKPGEKTRSVLELVLSRFSTSQAFYFIFSAAKNASDFFLSKKVSKHHAANTVPGKIQNLFDRAVSEGWDVSKYARNYKACPPSALNNILYDKVLKLPGIDYVPGAVLPGVEVRDE